MFLPEQSILVIADLHLGKATHFRKAGLLVPPASALKDYQVLHSLMVAHSPREVWFLGDLFHSDHNSEWRQLELFVQSHPQVLFTLIQGNHDILDRQHYDALGIGLVARALELEGLIFSHEPLQEVPAGKINIAGHIHPGFSLRGLGRQYLRLPCFYWQGNTLLLPAFGALTGLYMMDKVKDATIFAVLPERIELL